MFIDNQISPHLKKLLFYAMTNNNRPGSFLKANLPLIAYFFQQGGEEFFKNLKTELRKMPEDKKTFLEQYRYLEQKTRPDVLNNENENISVDGRSEVGQEKSLVFYFRYQPFNIDWPWQGSDLLQSSMMIEDLVSLIKQNKLSNFNKLIVVPRFNDDLPFFVQDELEKRFGQKWVDEHLEITNEYHRYDKDPNAHWIELVDGTFHNQNPGILGKVSDVIDKSYKKDSLICEDIFWPDHDSCTGWCIRDAMFNTGFGKNQAPTLKAVRESLLNRVIELDELVGRGK